MDRNLDALITDLAKRCQKIFRRAAEAVARTAVKIDNWDVPAETIQAARDVQAFPVDPSSRRLACTRVSCDEKVGILVRVLSASTLSSSFLRPGSVRMTLPYDWKRKIMEANTSGNFFSGAVLSS